MAKPENETDDAALGERLAKLSGALDSRSGEAKAPSQTALASGQSGRAMSTGIRVLSEFIAAILVGGFIGWALDGWLGTTPWGVVIFLMLGLAAGLWNVYRIATAESADNGQT